MSDTARWLLKKAVQQEGGVRKAARALDVQPSTVSRGLRGLQDPSWDTQVKCATLLGYDPALIFDGGLDVLAKSEGS